MTRPCGPRNLRPAAAGLAMPLAYWLGWKIGGTEQAELIFGGWLAGSLTALAAA